MRTYDCLLEGQWQRHLAGARGRPPTLFGGRQPAARGPWSGQEEVSAERLGEAHDHGQMSVVAALASAALAWALPGTTFPTSTRSVS